MNKLEKQKIEETEQDLYTVNSYISVNFIGMKKVPTEEEWLKINDTLAMCIRRLRNM